MNSHQCGWVDAQLTRPHLSLAVSTPQLSRFCIMSSPKKNNDKFVVPTHHKTQQKSPLPASPLPEAMDIDDEISPLESLQQTELLSQLFTLLLDIKNGKSLVRDFENNAGSLRLALSNIRKLLLQVNGITETVEERRKRIETLEQNNAAKRLVIQKLLENE